MDPIANNDLQPLRTLKDEFDPNFLEKLGVRAVVQNAIKNSSKLKNESFANSNQEYKMFAAITSELFYLKACVNCLNAYDPIAARANAYLATIAYDLFATKKFLTLKQIPVETKTVKKRFFGLFRTTKTEMMIPKSNDANHVEVTRSTIGYRTHFLQDKDLVVDEAEKTTIDDFIIEALKFYNVSDPDIAAFNDLEEDSKKLMFFAENVIYPFAHQCNQQAKIFYDSLDSEAYKVQLFSINNNSVREFYAFASKSNPLRKSVYGSKVDFWIKDLFNILTIYQVELIKVKKLNLRKFREGYEKFRDMDSHKISGNALKKMGNLPSPFVEFEFMFKLNTWHNMFDCFHPKKVNKNSILTFLAAIEDAKSGTFSPQNLRLTEDHLGNSFLFELLIGRNLYDKLRAEQN